MRDDRLSSTDKDTPAGKPGAPITLADQILADDQAHYDDVDPGLLASLRERILGETVDASAGPRDQLQQLPTPARVALAMLLVLGCGAIFLVMAGVRPDLDGGVALWLGGLHVLVIVAALVGVSLALRPTHRPPLGPVAWVGAAALLALPVVLSVVPGLWPGVTHAVPVAAHLTCGSTGMFVAIPATALVLLLERSRRPSAWRVLLAAAAGGLTAFVWSQWQCPAVHPAHLLLGHAGSGLVAGVAVLGVSRILGVVRG